MASPAPSLRLERELLRSRDDWQLLGGLDEVGRGALAGPVSVGLVVVSGTTRTAPNGVRDSKLLTPAARARLAPRLRRWGVARAVGHASPDEIDTVGILAGLRLAARRALEVVTATGHRPDVLLLDGNHDWFTEPGDVGLFAELDGPPPGPPVVTRIKADQRCASVAAASVIAKHERDSMMIELAGCDPALEAYGLAVNKGYSAPGHLEALRTRGATRHHRRSWRLPTGPVEAPRQAPPDVAVPRSLPGRDEGEDAVATAAASSASLVGLGHNGSSRHEGEQHG